MQTWPGGLNDEAGRAGLRTAAGDAVGTVPTRRWTLEQCVDISSITEAMASCVSHGGFVAGAERFDAKSFGISAAEVGAMDLQQRMLLEHGYTALHAAAHRRNTLAGGDGGVFLGIERPDWAFAQPPAARSSVYAVTGDNVSVAAGRISFTLGLQGPVSTVDTACSSAIAALHCAAHAVAQREASDAAVLAIGLKLLPHVTLLNAEPSMHLPCTFHEPSMSPP